MKEFGFLDDKKFMAYIIDRVIPFPKMLDLAGEGGATYDRNIYCPFHEHNYNTPSARLRKSDRGDTLFCYSERRIYKPSDVIKKQLIKTTIESIFGRIWNQLTEDQKAHYINDYELPIDYIPNGWRENEEEMDKFKTGEISITQLQDLILRSLS